MKSKSNDSYDSKGNSYNKHLKNTYGDGSSLPSAIGRSWDQFSNAVGAARSDGTAATSNFWGWLTGGKQDAKPGKVGAFYNFDPYRSSSANGKKKADTPSWKKPGPQGSMTMPGRAKEGTVAPPPEDPYAGVKSFAEYLAMANQMSSAQSSGPDYGALEANLRNNATQGSAKLAAMFGQLRGSIEADAAPIAQNYDGAKAAVQQTADQTNATTQQGYNAARDAQTKQMQALGIQDAAAVNAAQGGNAARDQAVAQSNIAQNTAANVGQISQNKASALDYNTNIGNAAGLEGAVQQSALQQQLAAKLAELQVAKSSSASQSRSNNAQLAFRLADFDNAKAQRRAAQLAGPTPDDMYTQAKTEKIYQDMAISQAERDDFVNQTGVSMDAAFADAQKRGVNINDQKTLNDWLSQYYKYNK